MTKKIILASHGRFASGMLSAAKMIIGELKGVDSFDLEDYESPYEIYKNIEENLKNSRICQRCNQRFFLINKNDFSSKYCEDCKTEIQRERDRMKKLKKRGGKQNPGQGGQI